MLWTGPLPVSIHAVRISSLQGRLCDLHMSSTETFNIDTGHFDEVGDLTQYVWRYWPLISEMVVFPVFLVFTVN